ncbi:hypothetical protein TRVA0_049S00408 [Trichomonascus vanleenenianus]|uniref:Mrx11p n=1 Tax=Trichomonascus vanleenenianus TaxID=2268995 RepID=UPI003ECB1E93
MILHEFTAIAPLFGLWGLFHYGGFIPSDLPEWLTTSGTDFIKLLAERNKWDFGTAEESARIILEGAAAYAIIKILLPVRAAVSLFLTPWFARVAVIPFSRLFRFLVPKRNLQPKPRDDKLLEQELRDSSKLNIKEQDPNKPSL